MNLVKEFPKKGGVEMKACARCHKVNEDNAKFCSQCGLLLFSNGDNHFAPPKQAHKEKTCAYCKGTGRVKEPANILGHICQVCKGTGKNQFNEDPQQCEVCMGSGRLNVDTLMGLSFVPCKRCRGAGWY